VVFGDNNEDVVIAWDFVRGAGCTTGKGQRAEQVEPGGFSRHHLNSIERSKVGGTILV
jgi:hypothetical protein